MARRPAIDQLLRSLPSKDLRQTVLFSATFPSDIQSLASYALRPGFQLVDCVGESAQQTADKVLSALPPNTPPPPPAAAPAVLAGIKFSSTFLVWLPAPFYLRIRSGPLHALTSDLNGSGSCRIVPEVLNSSAFVDESACSSAHLSSITGRAHLMMSPSASASDA